MDDLPPLHIVLVVYAFRVPPVEVFDRGAVCAVFSQHLVSIELLTTNVEVEVARASDLRRSETLVTARHLTADRTVQNDLSAVGADHVEVLDGAGLVIHRDSILDVLLFDCVAFGVGLDLTGDLHLGSGYRLDRLAATNESNRDNSQRQKYYDCSFHSMILLSLPYTACIRAEEALRLLQAARPCWRISS